MLKKKKRTKYVFAFIIRVVLQHAEIRLPSLTLFHSWNTHQRVNARMTVLFYPFQSEEQKFGCRKLQEFVLYLTILGKTRKKRTWDVTRWSTTVIIGRHTLSCLAWTVDGCLRPETLVRAARTSPTENSTSDESRAIPSLNSSKQHTKHSCSSILCSILPSPHVAFVDRMVRQADPALSSPEFSQANLEHKSPKATGILTFSQETAAAIGPWENLAVSVKDIRHNSEGTKC